MTYPKATTGDGPDSAPGVPSSPRFPELEARVLAYWETDRTFSASVNQREAGEDGANEFVFYDGPPFANGLPHYGHLLTGYVKDVIPRFQAMRGRRVERRFGWDCHGLPAELEAMSQLGLRTKDEILELGIEKFNEATRRSVLRYTDEWQAYVTRQARWVDFEHDYKTLDLTYMESVLWAFKSLYDKGLVYEGRRVLPYCWNDETPLSSHELRMDDDVYQLRRDPASTVWMELETGERALAWTTMPWTLVPNTNLVVGADIDYAVLDHPDGHRYLLAEARLAAYAAEMAGATQVGTVKGSDLVGRRYTPIFDFLVEPMADVPAAYTVLAGDFVTTDEGTGLVQCAPSHGEDDFAVCTAAGVPVIMTVDEGGRFTSLAPRFQGLQVFDANDPLLAELAERGLLVRRENYDHPYPHCWRCRNPLIYKAVSSWFVEVTKIKNRMGELNDQITWVPEHVKEGQFGKWLSNARDWSISRNRFWGSPIPIWKSDDPSYPRVDVYGSVAELEADFGELASRSDGQGGIEVTDLHRPAIDRLTRPNPDDPTGRSTMRRIEDVLDVWFDSGSMPYAQVHYPFENTEWFEHHYPGDFIVEYIGQTRGWFYTMHVLATALFDRPAFTSCICHGIVLGSDGQKMSKSLRNYPDVGGVFDRDGADAMRWFLMSSPILRGGNLIVTEQGIRESVRQVLLPLWNAWYFFSLYANAAQGGRGYDARRLPPGAEPADVLDRYILAKLREVVAEVGTQLDGLNVAAACEAAHGFLEVLSNWYIRRSRDRFWDGESDASLAAFDTLFTVLETTTRVLAPLLPLVTEEIWRGLTGGRSVHLTDWPDSSGLPDGAELASAMDRVREVCSAASALRKAEGLRVRLPLPRLTVLTPEPEALAPFDGLVADELNVRVVERAALDEADLAGFGVRRVLQVNARAAGPRLGRSVQDAIRAAKAGDWSLDGDGVAVVGGVALQEGEYTVSTVVEAGAADHHAVASLPRGGFVLLDTEVTPELAAEGLARDTVRAVQQARREAGFGVSDRIRVRLSGPDDVRAALHEHEALITAETLAESVHVAADAPADATVVTVGDGQKVGVSVSRA